MRGRDERSGSLFSYVDLEARVRSDHPLRTIRPIANAALADLSGEFAALYTDFGRPSIAPEKLLRAWIRVQTHNIYHTSAATRSTRGSFARADRTE